MALKTRPDPADMLSRVARNWGWALAFGILTVALGIVALAWPGRTLVVLAVLFGIQLIVTGIFRFVAAFAFDMLSGGTRVLMALLGVLSLIIGIYAVRHLAVSLLALGLLLGIYWVVSGVTELFTAISHQEMSGRGWTALMGGLSVVAGLILVSYPGISLVTLAVIVSVWLLVFGFGEIALAFQLRRLGHGARH
jgi:uncharacterized membrane protein HdeD (DUF308 family)